jgi:hypothetical protein
MIERLFLCAAFLASCGPPTVDKPVTPGLLLDAGMSALPPDRPSVGALPDRVPYPIATIHGDAPGAKRVIVQGSGDPLESNVLPDGTFCIDVPLRTPEAYELSIVAQSMDGLLSTPAGPIQVTFDPSAPTTSGAATCSGSDPAGCPGTREICGNGIDDDCNGLTDSADPACATCMDDALEPNDDTNAPRIEPGRYDQLMLCPGNPDFYGVDVGANLQLNVHLYFSQTEADVQLSLLDAVDRMRTVAQGMSTGTDELLTYTATAAGEYMVRVVRSSTAGPGIAYVMDLRVGN